MRPFALASLLLSLAACSSSNDVPCTSANAGSPITAVTIQDFKYTPSCFSVAKGSVVTFSNLGPSTHTVTTIDGPESFDSHDVPPGQTFTHTFGNTAGTFHIHCTIHAQITGTVFLE